MGKLRRLSGRDVCRILEMHGFIVERQRGSQIVMQRRAAGTTVTAIVPNHAEVNTGTLTSIIRQSGLPRQFFES